MPSPLLRPLRWRLILTLAVYCLGGAASQKLVPGVDEVFPFFGWSLFSKVPNQDSRYWLEIRRFKKHQVDPPVSLEQAPGSMVQGNRFIARKLVQRLGRAYDRGDSESVEQLRRLLEQSYFQGKARYELFYERYEPLEKWRTGASLERRSLAVFDSGEDGENP